MPEPTLSTTAADPGSGSYDLFDLHERRELDPAGVRPTLLLDRPGLKVLRLGLLPGQRMQTHDHTGCHVTVQCLSGTAAVELDGETVKLAPGQLLCFAGESRVSPGNGGESECSMLITLVDRRAAR